MPVYVLPYARRADTSPPHGSHPRRRGGAARRRALPHRAVPGRQRRFALRAATVGVARPRPEAAPRDALHPGARQGQRHDVALLGTLTLAALGDAVHPFERTLRPRPMTLPAAV